MKIIYTYVPKAATKDNTVNRLNIMVRLCSHQENFLKFPPQDENSNEVISSDRIGVGPGIYVQKKI